MAETTTVTYEIQVISKRYIRAAVLEHYVNGKLDDFGSEWSYAIKRDNRLEFTALRKLKDDELDFLQQRSNPNPPPLFV